jgi:uncharacterized protein (TIRG00374 family)
MQKQKVLKVAWNAFKWGIAVFGIWYVVSRMSWHDHVWALLPGHARPVLVKTAADTAGEADESYDVQNPSGGISTLSRDLVFNESDWSKPVLVQGQKEYIVGIDLSPSDQPLRLLLAESKDGLGAHFVPAFDVPEYYVSVPHPRVQIGVIRMVRGAKAIYLIAALAIFPITIFITSFRWNELLKAVDIDLSLGLTFVLNMVGLFYNTFMPGSTGGDLLKAYYVQRQTHHGTRAVMSVLVDRAIGLLALIILGGVMAALQWHNPKCRQVAIGAAAIIAALCCALLVFYVPFLHRASGLEFFLRKLPLQKQVNQAVEAMHIYAGRPVLATLALLSSFPVHAVVIVSALLCGIAFGLPVSWTYYWMAVPVIVLAGSIPISPQGAGVMEYFAINLLKSQHVTVTQAFALTMSIRLTQIFWNLAGGFFVLRGDYHAPTPTEQKQVEEEDEDKPKVS